MNTDSKLLVFLHNASMFGFSELQRKCQISQWFFTLLGAQNNTLETHGSFRN